MEPPPTSFSLAMPNSTASAQRREGTPRPRVQIALPSRPAPEAARRMRDRASSVSAEQASKRAPSSSIRKRRVKGVMTGRGAERSSASRRPSGLRRVRLVSSRLRASALSVMALISTLSASTDTLERGRSRNALVAKRRACSQPSGAGKSAASSRSETSCPPAIWRKLSIRASRSVDWGTSPITETPASFLRISTEKRGGATSSGSSTSIWSITREASTTRPAVDSALKRAASSGAVPIRKTCRPLVSTSAQGRPSRSSSFSTLDCEAVSIIWAVKYAVSTLSPLAARKVPAMVKSEESRMYVVTSRFRVLR